jgi:hypothetical protein
MDINETTFKIRLTCDEFLHLRIEEKIHPEIKHAQLKLTLIFPSCDPDTSISESLLKSTQSTGSSCIMNVSCRRLYASVAKDDMETSKDLLKTTYHFERIQG